jgi:hypothetical protein
MAGGIIAVQEKKRSLAVFPFPLSHSVTGAREATQKL